ncbi:MAG: 2-oxo acid dehydrogenase subunit E2 [Xanthobacteraceae bacterium]|nr:MAG: 2-oxo acid dehydrogenase subunit E2 [Xanthobacteraceae bacterium]
MDVIMPQLGETVAEGKILAWFKNVGDDVSEGDNIFEVETDKVTVEVQAITAGKLTEIRVGAGTVVKVGTVVAVIGGAAVSSAASPPPVIAAAAAPPAVAAKAAAPAPVAATPRPAGPLDPFNEVRTASGHYAAPRGADGVRMTPLARRLIAQSGIDLSQVVRAASARGDTRIRERDVRAAMQAAPARAAGAIGEPARLTATAADDAVPINTIRQRTGQRLAESWRTAPHVFQAIDIDFGAVDAVRARQKDRFKAQNGTSLTYLPFIARAVCLAIRDFPEVNARFDGDRLLVSRDINLGIAVDLSHKGLVVPVVRRAGELTLEGLAKAIVRQVEKARGGAMTPDDMSGGTYTITNNGSFGTLFTAPIINVPQAAILSTDAIRKRPAVIETPQGDFIAVRPVGMVAQSFDHRAFDGAYSAAFLSRLKEIIEKRDWNSEFA